ncbi:hypothetical protein NE646_15550, partial [Bittarella massiliensis]|nr:hypothetical protein [Bittarella massiliensis (ex Durand et al. 2017)]
PCAGRSTGSWPSAAPHRLPRGGSARSTCPPAAGPGAPCATLLAGFPGETEEQFEELCRFVDDMRFERLGCFAYSQEEGTPAARFSSSSSWPSSRAA